MMEQMVKNVTGADIARELGVSTMTVSRALNNKGGISLETKHQVIETAKRFGYVQNALGSGLASGNAKAIGCVVPELTDPFVGQVLEGVEELTQESGYALIMTSSPLEPDRQLSAINTLKSYQVSGIIVLCSRVQPDYLAELARSHAHIVLINSELSSKQLKLFRNSVRIDDAGAAQLAVSHLAEFGHRRIAHVTVANGLASSRARLFGYRQTLEGYGLEFDPDLVVEVEGAEVGGTEAGGAEAVRTLLDLESRPTAIFCYDDRLAIGALSALRRAGLHVPHDISVVGMDDIAIAEWLSPALTTIRQPARSMGRIAMEIVLKQMEGKPKLDNVVTAGELIVRESSGPLPAASTE